MEYEKEILYKLDLVNSVLEEINVPHLQTNQDFFVDESFHQKHYIRFKFQKQNSITLELVFSSESLQINMDRTNESFEWSEYQIKENPKSVKDIFRMILTSSIKIKYCGANYTEIFFYDKKGNMVKTLKYIRGLYLKLGCTTKEYKPIYN